MVTRGIHDFMNRAWGEARAAKDAYWAERIARLGPEEGLRVGAELRRQMRLIDPTWPSAADRQADLEHHVKMSAIFARAAPTRRR